MIEDVGGLRVDSPGTNEVDVTLPQETKNAPSEVSTDSVSLEDGSAADTKGNVSSMIIYPGVVIAKYRTYCIGISVYLHIYYAFCVYAHNYDMLSYLLYVLYYVGM